MKKTLTLITAFFLLGCKEDIAQLPDPVPLNEETIAHYCMMNIAEHPGPKAQIFLEGIPYPVFFAQVRDALTYLASAEQDGYIAAFYVSDMSSVPWETPGAANWMLADQAVYVIGSNRMGGMGVPEMVPFSNQSAAEEFSKTHGGVVLTRPDIPDSAFLSPVDVQLDPEDAS